MVDQSLPIAGSTLSRLRTTARSQHPTAIDVVARGMTTIGSLAINEVQESFFYLFVLFYLLDLGRKIRAEPY